MLALPLPQADAVVGDLRANHLPPAMRSLGAHIAVTLPWKDSEKISGDDLRKLERIAEQTAAFHVRFQRVGFGAGTVYLRPEPTVAIVALALNIALAFPQLRAESEPKPVAPHLPVAQAADVDQAQSIGLLLEQRLHRLGSIEIACDTLALFKLGEARLWERLRTFRFLSQH